MKNPPSPTPRPAYELATMDAAELAEYRKKIGKAPPAQDSGVDSKSES